MDSSVSIIFLGAILTFIATSLVEALKNGSQARSLNRQVRVLLQLELETLAEVFDRIKAKHEASGFYDFLLVDLLDNSVVRLDGIRMDTRHLRNEGWQRQYFKLINDVSLFAKDIRSIQNFYHQQTERIEAIKDAVDKQKQGETYEKFDTRQRNQKAVELIEIKRKLDELSNALK